MTWAWIALGFVVALVGSLVVEPLKSMATDEVKARVERLPVRVLRMAQRRLTVSHRTRVFDEEWWPELEFIARETEGLPVTRFIRAMRFACGLLWSAPLISKALDVADSPAITESIDLANSVDVPLGEPSWLPPMTQLLRGVDGRLGPVVLGVNGVWGSGKSKAMSLLRQRLDGVGHTDAQGVERRTTLCFRASAAADGQRSRLLTAWFDPWTLGEDEPSAPGALVDVIASAAKQLPDRTRVFDQSSGGATGWNRLSRVGQLLERQNASFVIFIDNIDRCSTETAAAVLYATSQIGIVVPSGRIRFVVAFDSESLAVRLGESLLCSRPAATGGTSSALGRSFLEKTVQVEVAIEPFSPVDIGRWIAFEDQDLSRRFATQPMPDEARARLARNLEEMRSCTPRDVARAVAQWHGQDRPAYEDL